jgi:hypothetical protein
MIASLALIACGAAAPAPEPIKDQAQLARALQGFTPGKPVTCIPQARAVYSTEVIGDVILFKANRRLIYRNDTVGTCGSSFRGNVLVSQNYESQLCKGLIMQSVDPLARFETGGCALGTFTPYTKAN